MEALLQDERLCSPEELRELLDYLDKEGDGMAHCIRAGIFRVLLGNVRPRNRVAQLKHSWPTMPGPIEYVPKGTRYIEVGESRTLFHSNPNDEWVRHETKIEGMLTTLHSGGKLPGRVVMWEQWHPLRAWVIIIGNHSTAALYSYALEACQELTLPVYRVERLN